MGHKIVVSEFLIPTADFALPVMLLAKLHLWLSSLFYVEVEGGGGGGMFVHVCLLHVQVRMGEQDLNITCAPAAQLSQNFVWASFMIQTSILLKVLWVSTKLADLWDGATLE
jgi:hypothetical protein